MNKIIVGATLMLVFGCFGCAGTPENEMASNISKSEATGSAVSSDTVSRTEPKNTSEQFGVGTETQTPSDDVVKPLDVVPPPGEVNPVAEAAKETTAEVLPEPEVQKNYSFASEHEEPEAPPPEKVHRPKVRGNLVDSPRIMRPTPGSSIADPPVSRTAPVRVHGAPLMPDLPPNQIINPVTSKLTKSAPVLAPGGNQDEFIRELITQANEAISLGDFETADARIQTMKKYLPAESLTLVRMRAWYALSTGNLDRARVFYRTILDRVSNDENAGLNLAMIEVRTGNTEAALKILADLDNRIPNSKRVKEARQLLEGGITTE